MSEMFTDDRWYGARYVESIDDTLHIVAGRILRDLTDERDFPAKVGAQPVTNPVPRNANFVIAVVGNTITISAFLTTSKPLSTGTLDKVRDRVMTVADRYNWEGRKNKADRRFYLRCNVKPTTTSLHGLISGALLG